MSPPKRKNNPEQNNSEQSGKKRFTKSDREKLICKKKLDALDLEESQTKDDRFSPTERRRLLEAYDERGFKVFQDIKLLHQYFPQRKESDLKGLVQRLRVSLQPKNDEMKQLEQPLDEWQKLCLRLMGNFAKDKKINLDDVFADVLMAEAIERESSPQKGDGNDQPNYPDLLRSFAQLLMGRFPDNMSPISAQLSMKLFDHINGVVDSIDLDSAFSSLQDGTWLDSTVETRRKRQELALKGMEEIDGITKKCPSVRDLERNRHIEALCLELPKFKRITDVLNPLHINESLVSTLMGSIMGESG